MHGQPHIRFKDMASWILKHDASNKQPSAGPECFLAIERALYIHGREGWVAPWAKLEAVKNQKKKSLYPCRKSKPVSPFRPTFNLVPILPVQLSWLIHTTRLIISVPILQFSDVQVRSENKFKRHTIILVLVIFNPNKSNLDVTLLLTDWFPHQNVSNYPTVRRSFLFPLPYQPP